MTALFNVPCRSDAMSLYSEHLDRAEEFFADGNYEAAKAAAQYAIEHCDGKTDGRAMTVVALCLRKLEFNDEAMTLLQQLAQTAPTPCACAEYALMRAERNNCDETTRTLALQAIQQDPDIPSAYLALFWCDVTACRYLDAVKNLKRGIHRGGEFPENRAFDLVRGWCQKFCDADSPRDAFGIVSELGDLFNTFDFVILHARIADICGEYRAAVPYYKKALSWLRPGSMRNEVLEAIARIAI